MKHRKRKLLLKTTTTTQSKPIRTGNYKQQFSVWNYMETVNNNTLICMLTVNTNEQNKKIKVQHK